jgi:folate-binding protein YgfZ
VKSPLLATPGAVPTSSGKTAAHYGDPLGEQRKLISGAGVVDLSDLGIVTVTGPDRHKWLHAITSAHLEQLPTGHSTELLVLSPQGHIEHSAAVVDDGQRVWLLTETASGLAAWLTSMRFRMRVEVAEPDGLVVVGRTAAEPLSVAAVSWVDSWPEVAPGGTRYGLPTSSHPGAGWRLALDVVPRSELGESEFRRLETGRLAGGWALEALRIAAGRPCFKDVDHRTLPHELDWLRTAVHLKKGCYRGQESVARVHNLGRPPRRLVLLDLDGSMNVLPQPGAQVLAGAKTLGALTAAAYHYELGPIALAIIRRATPITEQLTVPTSDGAVSASQTELAGVDGVTPDRPRARGPLAKGLERKSLL